MGNRHEHYLEFRRKYPEFIYSGYNISESDRALGLDFHFIIPGLAEFRPRWEIAKPVNQSLDPNDETINKLAFYLGMVELISYWKTTCSPSVRINCGCLSDAQTAWWKKLYEKGLGEFFFTNGIDYNDDFMTIINDNCSSKKCAPSLPKSNIADKTKVLIPIGGGKDSAVTLELLNGYAERFCYIINPRKATLDTVSAGKIPQKNIVTANRTLDQNMLSLNRQGFLNGHTPFSALVAFSSVLTAFVHGIGFIALSNESSANESTVPDSDVNHQYSKSLEFESDFIDYEKRYINSGTKYFSLLRPLTELGIARIFSGLDKYHHVFRSCNVGSKQDKWCADCPKCLFVYIILSPFIEQTKMAGIFGKDMLNDAGLIPTLEKLIGLQPEKPFECVGSRDEVNAALQELVRQYQTSNTPLPLLLRYYKNLDIPERYDIDELSKRYDDRNHVPEQFVPAIKSRLK